MSLAVDPVLIDKGVGPGDVIATLPTSGEVRISVGLRLEGGYVVSNRSGVLHQMKGGKVWVEGRQKKYLPAEGDEVIGIVVDRHAENYLVDIGGPFRALLPILAFEGATRRNRPYLNSGDLVYVLITSANRDLDPVVTCLAPPGGPKMLGPLKEGLLVSCSLTLCRQLLSKTQVPVLEGLGKKLKYEVAVGMNGRLWIKAEDCTSTIVISHAITQSEGKTPEEVQHLLEALLGDVGTDKKPGGS